VADAVAWVNTLLPLQHRLTYHGCAAPDDGRGCGGGGDEGAARHPSHAGGSFSGDCKVWLKVPGQDGLKGRVLSNCRSDDTAGQLMARMLKQSPYLNQLYRGGAKHFELVEVSAGGRGGVWQQHVLDRKASPLSRMLGWGEDMVTAAYTLGDPLSRGTGTGTRHGMSHGMSHDDASLHAGFVMRVARPRVPDPSDASAGSASRDGQRPSRPARSARSATVSGARPRPVAAPADCRDGGVRPRTRSLFSSLSVGRSRSRSRNKTAANGLRKTKSAPAECPAVP